MFKEEIKLKKLYAEVAMQKYVLSKLYKFKHKNLLRTLDILLISCFIMNIGAVVMTNAMVSTKYNKTNYYEMNPIQRYLNGYAKNKDDTFIDNDMKPVSKNIDELWYAILKQLLFWCIILAAYIYTRFNIYTYQELIMLSAYVAIMFYCLSFDFFNDLGYLIGEVIKKWI